MFLLGHKRSETDVGTSQNVTFRPPTNVQEFVMEVFWFSHEEVKSRGSNPDIQLNFAFWKMEKNLFFKPYIPNAVSSLFSLSPFFVLLLLAHTGLKKKRLRLERLAGQM